MHSIFKIGISRNMKCAYMVGFLKYSHIYIHVCRLILSISQGHGCFPAMFKHDNDKVAFSNKLEQAGEKKDSGGLK